VCVLWRWRWRWHRPRDPQRLFSLSDLDLGNTRFLEQLDHFFDFPNIHAR
jgi:hypothetical protein